MNPRNKDSREAKVCCHKSTEIENLGYLYSYEVQSGQYQPQSGYGQGQGGQGGHGQSGQGGYGGKHNLNFYARLFMISTQGGQGGQGGQGYYNQGSQGQGGYGQSNEGGHGQSNQGGYGQSNQGGYGGELSRIISLIRSQYLVLQETKERVNMVTTSQTVVMTLSRDLMVRT